MIGARVRHVQYRNLNIYDAQTRQHGNVTHCRFRSHSISLIKVNVLTCILTKLNIKVPQPPNFFIVLFGRTFETIK